MAKADETGFGAGSAGHEHAGFSENESPSGLASFDDEDFLFHLYRGSELLQDNCVPEAKEELERALGLRPRDVEGQGLLGVVYFRLGMYPRAIEIYEKLIRDVPREVTPRVNLALCYLKTGQLLAAREALEEVLRLVPHHQRAWGYLGLVFERLSDYVKAQASFERAGQPHMARRMQQLIDERSESRPADSSPPERLEIRQAAADAALELEQDVRGFTSAEPGGTRPPSPGRWVEPGQEVIPTRGRTSQREPSPRPPSERPRTPSPGPAVVSVVPAAAPPVAPPPAGEPEAGTPSEHARAVQLPAPSGPSSARVGTRMLAVAAGDGFVVRLDVLRSVSTAAGGLRHAPVLRRGRGRELDEPLGGGSNPFVRFDGSSELTLSIREGELHVMTLGAEFLFLREQRLVGFDASLNHESGRLPTTGAERTPIVQLSGQGRVVLEAPTSLKSLAVTAESNLLLRAASVIGWTGRLLPRALPPTEAPGSAHGFLAFSGDGAVFIDIA